MGLTYGSGPFGPYGDGEFNREPPERKGLLYLEDSPRRMRAVIGSETVADSRRMKLLHEYRHQPVYYFPVEDVREDLLEPSDRRTRCPHKGEATHWSVRVAGRLTEAALWGYLDPLPGAPPLAGYRAFYWDKVDRWLEEDDEAIVHARDPYHRIDVRETGRRVRVEVAGEPVAESTRTKVLFEAGLPPRWYFPREDVRMELLVPSDKRTGCAYKGFASYWSLRADVAEEADLAWTYEEPQHDALPVRGRIAFFDERVDLLLDGELQPRPQTTWSPGGR